MMMRWVYINGVIILIWTMDFVTVFVLKKANWVILFPFTGPHAIKDCRPIIPFWVSIANNIFKFTHRSISNKNFNNVGKFCYKMWSCYSSYWSSVNTNLTFYLNTIYQKLKNSFSINSLLTWVKIWWEYTLLRITISSAVPNQYVSIPSKKKV